MVTLVRAASALLSSSKWRRRWIEFVVIAIAVTLGFTAGRAWATEADWPLVIDALDALAWPLVVLTTVLWLGRGIVAIADQRGLEAEALGVRVVFPPRLALDKVASSAPMSGTRPEPSAAPTASGAAEEPEAESRSPAVKGNGDALAAEARLLAKALGSDLRKENPYLQLDMPDGGFSGFHDLSEIEILLLFAGRSADWSVADYDDWEQAAAALREYGFTGRAPTVAMREVARESIAAQLSWNKKRGL